MNRVMRQDGLTWSRVPCVLDRRAGLSWWRLRQFIRRSVYRAPR